MIGGLKLMSDFDSEDRLSKLSGVPKSKIFLIQNIKIMYLIKFAIRSPI